MDIFKDNNYKNFLHFRLKNLPKNGRGLKTKLAQHLSINSTLVSQILSGDKDFTLEQAQKVAQFLGLQKIETDYFILLVQINRAGTKDLKDYYIEKREQLKKEGTKLSRRIDINKGLTDLERSVFYSSKIYSSVHLYTSIEQKCSLEKIMERFKLTRIRTVEIITFLISAGLIYETNGHYIMAAKSTHLDKGSPFLLNHHMNWRAMALEKADHLSDEEMMYTGNFSLSKKDFLKIREELFAHLQKVLKTVHDSPAEELANLNIDFFWM